MYNRKMNYPLEYLQWSKPCHSIFSLKAACIHLRIWEKELSNNPTSSNISREASKVFQFIRYIVRIQLEENRTLYFCFILWRTIIDEIDNVRFTTLTFVFSRINAILFANLSSCLLFVVKIMPHSFSRVKSLYRFNIDLFENNTSLKILEIS